MHTFSTVIPEIQFNPGVLGWNNITVVVGWCLTNSNFSLPYLKKNKDKISFNDFLICYLLLFHIFTWDKLFSFTKQPFNTMKIRNVKNSNNAKLIEKNNLHFLLVHKHTSFWSLEQKYRVFRFGQYAHRSLIFPCRADIGALATSHSYCAFCLTTFFKWSSFTRILLLYFT